MRVAVNLWQEGGLQYKRFDGFSLHSVYDVHHCTIQRCTWHGHSKGVWRGHAAILGAFARSDLCMCAIMPMPLPVILRGTRHSPAGLTQSRVPCHRRRLWG